MNEKVDELAKNVFKHMRMALCGLAPTHTGRGEWGVCESKRRDSTRLDSLHDRIPEVPPLSI